MRYHVGWYTEKQSLKSIDQKGALIESGKVVVINTSCTRVKVRHTEHSALTKTVVL